MQTHYHWATKRRWYNEKQKAKKRKAELKRSTEVRTKVPKPLDDEAARVELLLALAIPREVLARQEIDV